MTDCHAGVTTSPLSQTLQSTWWAPGMGIATDTLSLGKAWRFTQWAAATWGKILILRKGLTDGGAGPLRGGWIVTE